MEQLDFILNGGETIRYHTTPTLRNQRVDSHSFNVAMLQASVDRQRKCQVEMVAWAKSIKGAT